MLQVGGSLWQVDSRMALESAGSILVRPGPGQFVRSVADNSKQNALIKSLRNTRLTRCCLRQAEAPESQSSHRYGRVDFPCIMTTLLLIRAFSLCCPGLASTFWSSWIED